jgi:hypothetical protein
MVAEILADVLQREQTNLNIFLGETLYPVQDQLAKVLDQFLRDFRIAYTNIQKEPDGFPYAPVILFLWQPYNGIAQLGQPHDLQIALIPTQEDQQLHPDIILLLIGLVQKINDQRRSIFPEEIFM